MKNPIYFSKKLIEVAKKNTAMSPSTWHKIMNPFCGPCLYERGKKWLALQS